MTENQPPRKSSAPSVRYSVQIEREGEGGLASLRLPAVGKARGKTAWIERRFSCHAFAFVVSGRGKLIAASGPARAVAGPAVFYLEPDITYRYGPLSGSAWDECFVTCTGARVREWVNLEWWPKDPGPYPVADPERLVRAHQRIYEELGSALPGAADRAKLIWERLVHDLHAGRASSAGGPPAIRERVEQWRLSPDRPWDLREEAKRCGLSYSRFRECFRERFGIAPHRYLTTLRMDYAARRLVQSDRPVKRLASDLGYSSLEGFYRAFRNIHGLPPGAFRRQRRF